MKRPILLLIVTVALTAFGSAHAEGNRTLACSGSLLGGGCWVEQPLATFGKLEIAIGVDGFLAWDARRVSYLAPYVIVGYYEREWSWWVEFAIPETRVPTLGKPDAIRAGFTVRF